MKVVFHGMQLKIACTIQLHYSADLRTGAIPNRHLQQRERDFWQMRMILCNFACKGSKYRTQGKGSKIGRILQMSFMDGPLPVSYLHNSYFIQFWLLFWQIFNTNQLRHHSELSIYLRIIVNTIDTDIPLIVNIYLGHHSPSQYMKIYHSLFESHLTYGISCWGRSYKSKLQKIFCLQKRCIRILFGRTYSFDHHEFYYSCARTKTYTEHMAQKDFNLEHTKPLFVKIIYLLYIIYI